MRPFTDSSPHELILEIGDSATLLHWNTMRLEFFGETITRMGKLLEVVATKSNLPVKQPLGGLMKNGGASSEPASPGRSGLSEEMVRVIIGEECGVWVDGVEKVIQAGEGNEDSPLNHAESSGNKKRKMGEVSSAVYTTSGGVPKDGSWIVKTGQWRLRVQNQIPMGKNGIVNAGKGSGEWECVLVGVKLDAVSGQRGRNLERGFLG